VPIVEFACAACDRVFEDLVRGEERPACPGCGGRDLRRRFSTFGVGAPAPAPPAGGCGSCGDPRGPGSCALE
jgi:putative FmdB family regulatory protein